MVDANEESEIFDSLGMVTRTTAAGAMQTAELSSRRAQMSQSTKEAEAANQQRYAEAMQRLADRDHKQEATLAQVIRSDSYQRHFWAHAGSEQIADYVTASAHLAPRHPEARSAYMHLSDVLRNDYGINIEQMNGDHPTSLMDRHHALRKALDDYFAGQRMDAEADQDRGQNAATVGAERIDSAEAADSETTQQPVVADSEAARTSESQSSSADETQARAAAAQARSDKLDSLADAQQYKGEARLDAAHPSRGSYRRPSASPLPACKRGRPRGSGGEEPPDSRCPDTYQRELSAVTEATNLLHLWSLGAQDHHRPHHSGPRFGGHPMSETFTEEFTDELIRPEQDEREPYYPHAQAWVVDWLLPHYRRDPKTRRWDPQWWRYEEVATLLESLWETWEQMRWEGATGMVVFFRDYLWPVMDVITSEDGPLWSYNATRQREVPPTWEHEPAPQGYFAESE